jgi:hypothetical protein
MKTYMKADAAPVIVHRRMTSLAPLTCSLAVAPPRTVIAAIARIL